jgi:hypothetical protein
MWKTETRLDQTNRCLDHFQTALAVVSLACLLGGLILNSQIYCDLSQEPKTITLTLTSTSVTQSTASSTRTIPSSSHNVTLTDHEIFSDLLSRNCTHVETLREAQTTWHLKELADNLATGFLVVFLAMSGIRWVKKRTHDERTAPPVDRTIIQNAKKSKA